MKSNFIFLLTTFALVALVSFIFNSCTKQYIVSLSYGQINVPKVVMAGQPIVCQVQIVYMATQSPLSFNGFQTKTIANDHYAITASAEWTSHGESSEPALLLIMNTTYVVDSTHRGQYILDFVVDNKVFQSDTVLVVR